MYYYSQLGVLYTSTATNIAGDVPEWTSTNR